MTFRRTRRQPPAITDVPTPIDPIDPVTPPEVPDSYYARPAVPPPLPESVAEGTPIAADQSEGRPDADDPDGPLSDAIPLQPADIHVSIRQRRLSPAFNQPIVLIVLLLVVVGIFGGLSARGQIPLIVQSSWPLLIVLFSAVWFLRALSRQSGAGLLASSALFGLSLSLLLALTGGLPFGQTWVGLTILCTGVGTLLRGLLWRSTTT